MNGDELKEAVHPPTDGGVPYHTRFEVKMPAPFDDTWTIDRAREITVILGRNGSGKSLLLRAIRDQVPGLRHYVVPERGGNFGFNINDAQSQTTGEDRAGRTRSNIGEHFRTDIAAKVLAYFQTRGAQPEKTFTTSPGPEIIRDAIRTVTDEFSIEMGVKSSPLQIIRNTGNARTKGVNANSMSSGECEVISLVVELSTMCAIWAIEDHSKRPSESHVLLVDEPDTHLHPDLQQDLAKAIASLQGEFHVQFVIATHSTTLLSALGFQAPNRVSVVYLDRSQSSRTFSAFEFDSTVRELATCLGGHLLMGPIVGAPLLLVEGEDDYDLWSQVPRYHKTRFVVIPCNGDEIHQCQRTLERIFASLSKPGRPPSGYALLDGDRPLPQDARGCPQNHILYRRLACLEAENLYLSGEVLRELGHPSPDDAVSLLRAAAMTLPSDVATVLTGLKLENRQTADVKKAIKHIVDILDPKHRVPWTIRVGKTLGKLGPVGELGQFLGEPVSLALWPQ